MEKRIFTSSADLQTYLTSKGFIIYDNNTKMRWTTMPADTMAYWIINAGGDFNFHKSDNSDNGLAFELHLTDFSSSTRGWCGCIFIPLVDGGCILYLTSLAPSTSINYLTLCCEDTYTYEIDPQTQEETVVVDETKLIRNGVIVCTPAEADGYCRCQWRSKDNRNDKFYWDIDNCHGFVSKGGELPRKYAVFAGMTISLVPVYFNSGYWSHYIYEQVLGEIVPPSRIFKINGQRYISLTDNTTYRCPVFRLPPQEVTSNPSASTQEYSTMKTYKVKDYCIYNGLLWRCTTAVTTPEPFDTTKWTVTTVRQEIMAE